MSRPVGQLERALEDLTIGLHQRADARRRSLGDTRTGEYMQQVHVDLAGVAGPVPAYADRAVNWELPFLYAPAQRRSELDRPHFNRGFEIIGNADTLIQLDAHVIAWTITEEQWFVGATVRFSVVAPLVTSKAVPYSAIAHLSFQGYGAPAQRDEVFQ